MDISIVILFTIALCIHMKAITNATFTPFQPNTTTTAAQTNTEGPSNFSEYTNPNLTTNAEGQTTDQIKTNTGNVILTPITHDGPINSIETKADTAVTVVAAIGWVTAAVLVIYIIWDKVRKMAETRKLNHENPQMNYEIPRYHQQLSNNYSYLNQTQPENQYETIKDGTL